MWILRRFGLSFVVLLCLVAVGCGRSSAPDSSEAPRQHANGAQAGDVSGPSSDGSEADPGQGSSRADASDPGQASNGASEEDAAQRSGGATSTDPGQRSGGAPEASGAPGAAGAPGDRSGNAQAVGAPIRIPSFLHDQGRPLAEVRSEIVSGIERQCGGVVCLKLRDEAREGSGYDSCTFWKTEPPQESTVRRGTTVVVVSGTGPCPTDPTVESPPTSVPDDTSPPSSEPDGAEAPTTS
jgi:hypothetical protein